MLTTKEAADLIGMTQQSVSRACRRGTLTAERRGRDWFIRREDAEAYRANPRKAGRPKKATPEALR